MIVGGEPDVSGDADPVLQTLLVARDAAQTAVEAYLAARAEGEFVPLKIAASIWGITSDAAWRRAKKVGVKRFGRWLIPRTAL